MERIVVETSEQRKAALLETVQLQGDSLAEWIEEQITIAVPAASRTAAIGTSPQTITDLLDGVRVGRTLSEIDWSFTDDDTRYLTHDIHPYPAKFIPQIPTNLIARLSLPGDVVLDPFGGSATTAVEAVRLRRRAVSIDANPLAALIGRVKTGYMTSEARTQLESLSAALETYIQGSSSGGKNWSASLLRKHEKLVPDIPNLSKWFSKEVTAELALIRFLLIETTEGLAEDAALVALSRIVTRVSNQESETRYVSVEKNLKRGHTLRAFNEALKTVVKRLEAAAREFGQADARFLEGDSRDALKALPDASVDLIVTSPPYPNATDYHLYHRFRLFWLGFDPRAFGAVEIGSHLKHQRRGTGFEEYASDMRQVLASCYRVLQPGRYAVFVVGDAQFEGKAFSTSGELSARAAEVGFETVAIVPRPIHQTKRSFSKPARRARTEELLVLQRPNAPIGITIALPAYRMWPFEEHLGKLEAAALLSAEPTVRRGALSIQAAQPAIWNLRRLTFAGEYAVGPQAAGQPTWQRTLENGDADGARRKDPKYATHAIHAFKGKFYPQLAKSLLNISGAELGGKVLDPFCGSGTVLLEGMLNGFLTYGCDFNPLAAKIARAKTSSLMLDRSVLEGAIHALEGRLQREPKHPVSLDQFPEDTHEELRSWFPAPVLGKLNRLLSEVRLFGDPSVVEFFEVILSSVIRDVSHQDPNDLRIRRRKVPLEDAPVAELFLARLSQQHTRLKKYWAIANRQPGPIFTPSVINGDNRQLSELNRLGLSDCSVDCVVTSPPYATALPYIDTDRLSLLAIMGVPSASRSLLERELTGSREIRTREKRALEDELSAASAEERLPSSLVTFLRGLQADYRRDGAGFRRENMPALLWRYFSSMKSNLDGVRSVLKPGARAYYVGGDSRTSVGGEWVPIKTCDHICEIAEDVGLRTVSRISIDVTTENLNHIKNAITENQVLVFEKAA